MSEHGSPDVESLAEEMSLRLRALDSLKTENVRAVRREFSQRLKNAAPQSVIELALRLIDQRTIEHRDVAYELVYHHRSALKSLRAREVEQLGQGINSWGVVDAFASYVAGPAWRENQIPDKLIHSWARSQDRWWRRAALVSTVALNTKARGGTGDTRRTLAVCRMLVKDRDNMVVKALSWALRQLSKHDPKAVCEFLGENENVLAPRVLREVRSKLSTGLKNPRRK